MESASINYFSVTDMPGSGLPTTQYGNFDSVDGGDLTNSLIPYTIVDGNGNATVKYIPGQTSYSDFKLGRPLNDIPCQEIYDWYIFATTTYNKPDAYRNITIAAIDMQGAQQVIWNIYNALPVKIGGFSYNQYTGSRAKKFSAVIRAERVEIQYDL